MRRTIGRWVNNAALYHHARPSISRVEGAVVAAFLLLLVSLVHPGSARAQETEPSTGALESLEAESWALMDRGSGRYLAGESPDERRAPAATANVMTALVALEEAQGLDSEVTVPEEAERFVGFTYSNVGLIAGERLSVRELIEAMLVSSGTDATYTLAYHLGYGDPQRFVQKMNDKAQELSLDDTHFENPTGVDEEGNYSSARDLATISQRAMQEPELADIVGTKEATISTQNREIELYNTNELLYYYPAATGIKTGGSPKSGSSIVAGAERDGESYIAVVLGAHGAEQASGAARTVLRRGFAAYADKPLAREGEAFAKLPLTYRKNEEATLVARDEVTALVGSDSWIERRVRTWEAPEGASKGEELGTVEVFVDGAEAGESPLTTERGYLRPSVLDKAQVAALWPIERLSSWLQRRVT